MWEVNTHKHTQHRSPILFLLDSNENNKKLKKRRRPWKFLLSQKRSLKTSFVLLCHCTRKVFFLCCCCGKADRSERREIELEREKRPEQSKVSLSVCGRGGRGLRYVKRPDLDDRQIIIKKNHLNSTGIFLFVW